MITDALWQDLDGDESAELVLAGEWMPLRVFKHDEDGTFTEITERAGLAKTHGWWNTLLARDRNGVVDAVISYSIQGRSYPVAWRDELLGQVPELVRSFPTYASYANATLEDVLTPAQRDEALHLDAYEAATRLFENLGDGTFRVRPLPLAAQVAPVNAVLRVCPMYYFPFFSYSRSHGE